MSVRSAGPGDLDIVLELIVESAGRLDEIPSSLQPLDLELWRAHLFGIPPAANVVLAFEGSAPVGYALWYPTFAATVGRTGIWIDDLFVREPYRRRGHARALLTDLRGRTRGRIDLVADDGLVAADLYRELGAEPVTRGTRFRWQPIAD